MAEESPILPGDPSASGGGLGFWFKWNLGRMHDTLDYMKLIWCIAATIMTK